MRIVIFIATLLFLVPVISRANQTDYYFSGGAAFSRLSNNSSLYINSFMMNDYDTNTKTITRPAWGIGIGQTIPDVNNHPVSLSFALLGYYLSFGTLKGIESPFANDGDFDTLNYQFKAESLAAMLESRLAYTDPSWQPFGLIGIGFAWNHLFDYSEVPSNNASSSAATPNAFKSNVISNLAYEIGVGIQHPVLISITPNVQYIISLDYRYMNLGTGKLGPLPTQTTTDRLKVSHLDNQALMFTLKATI